MSGGALDFDFIDDWLAVGARVDASHGPALEGLGIGRVIDLRAEAGDAVPDWRLERLHLPTVDLAAPTLAQLDEGVAWALAGKLGGVRVLVHCEHGVGRSAVLACCCLVALGDGPLDALTKAKDRRSRIAPSPVQLEILLDWATERRRRAGLAPDPIDWETLARVAYRHLAES